MDHCLSTWALAFLLLLGGSRIPFIALGLTLSLISILSAYGPAEIAPNQGPVRSVEAEFLGCRSLWAGVLGRENMAQEPGYPASVHSQESISDRGHLVNVSGYGLESG